MLGKKLVLIFCVFAIAAWAQSTASVGGPVTGFIYDGQTTAIRPMLGIPGAAYLGAPATARVDAASIAPDGTAALAMQSGRLLLYTGLGSKPVAVAVSGAIAADHFAWSGDSSAAALYSSKSKQAQVLTGLAHTPAAGAPIDLSSLAGPVTALAFDGTRVILGVQAATASGIYIVDADTAPQRIAPAANPSAIALAGADLYFADGQSQQIWHVKSYATSPAPVLFANDSSIASPAGLQLSADGARLYAANAGNQKLTIYEIATRLPAQTIDLSFTPTRLDRFGSASVLLLNDTGQGPLYVLNDNGSAKPVVYFVPAPTPKPRPGIRIKPV